jgi:5'-3' exonuclease, N-terminal resolvase-like domain
MKYLVFDISNLLYRTFYVQRDEDDETIAGMATHSALVTLNKYFRKHKPDRVVMAFDRQSWRKEYTSSDQCLSKKPYKGHRRKDMSPAQQVKYQRFLNHLSEFEAMITNHTTIITLAGDRLEADDVIAGFCQRHKTSDDQIVLISSDSDMLQLMRYPNVVVISPADDKQQFLADFDEDPELFLFAKCIRGDTSDNVQSAYPRVHMTKIREAYKDLFARTNMMKTTWTNQNNTTFRVQDLFEENQLLIDLEKQPDDIRILIEQNVTTALEREREFSLFFILKFIGKYKLVKIKESIDQYIPLLSK